jgi:hypothetical protein
LELLLIDKISDLIVIRVFSDYGKSNEWLTCSEKFLAKAKRYGLKDICWGDKLFPRLVIFLMFIWKKERRK